MKFLFDFPKTVCFKELENAFHYFGQIAHITKKTPFRAITVTTLKNLPMKSKNHRKIEKKFFHYFFTGYSEDVFECFSSDFLA